MRILAIDIGEGTKDILVYDQGVSYKFILPSPTHHFAREVEKTNEDLIISGRQMGGGSFAKAIRRHQKKGFEVYMTEEAAKTIRNDLDKVRSQGIKLIPEEEVDSYPGRNLKIGDLEIEKLFQMLRNAWIDTDFDAIAVAVQDHGQGGGRVVSQIGKSDRECRFEMFKEKLKTNRRLESFAYLNQVPKEFSRMNSLLESIRPYYDKPIIIMDTSLAACLGVLEDEKARNKKSIVAINIGNLHTTGFSLKGPSPSETVPEICGFFEHHTHLVDEIKLINLELKLCKAELEFEEVYQDGGHGAISLERNQPEITLITGPNREKAKGLVERSTMYRYALPGGDEMLAGCLGLVRATKYLLKERGEQ